MPVVINAATGIFTAITDNARKNDQQNFKQDQAALQAQYERDITTTKSFEEWAIDQRQDIQQFNMATSGTNTTKYAIASVIMLVGGIMVVYLIKND